MSRSIHALREEVKNFVFKKVVLEYQDNSTLIKLLPHLVDQDTRSILNGIFHLFLKNEQSVSGKKTSIDTLKTK